MRVRRHNRPGRCLYIPKWVFKDANLEAPEIFRDLWETNGAVGSGIYPTLLDGGTDIEGIFCSHSEFRYLQKRILRFYRFWNPGIRLRKAVSNLEQDVKYSAHSIQSKIGAADNTLVVAHYFFALQRRLQLKVVSNDTWTAFLPKRGSSKVFQNNPSIISSFEEKLSIYSGHIGIPIASDISRLLQQCCLLMEEYVAVYAKGDRTRLVYTRGVSGGGGRGTVDTYNLLCDLLRYICEDEGAAGLKKPRLRSIRKFLAKDIMAWNSSFADDAFANGKVPGWETWLAARRAELEPFANRPF